MAGSGMGNPVESPWNHGLQRPQFYPSAPLAANKRRGNGASLKLHLTTSATYKIFTAHGAGYVMVGDERYNHSIVVTPQQVLTDWRPQDFDALAETHFEYFLAFKPEILLFGTGTQLRFPHPHLYRQLIAARIGVECMDTPAACRTYNILVAEDRHVVAAILL
jgi:uncharacterized protein